MDNKSLRKAAILVNALDSRSADALLDQMSEENAAAVRRAVMDLVDVDPTEQEEVIQAFLASQGGRRAGAGDAAGANNAANNGAAKPREPAPSPQKQPAHSGPLFEFLHEADAQTVHAFLHTEHPQTVAIVLAHLPPRHAAEVLRLLEPSEQTDVLKRVAQLDTMDIEVLRDVEDEMAVVFSTRFSATTPGRGLATLKAILDVSQDRQRDDWLRRIETVAPDVARRVKPPRRWLAADDVGDRRQPTAGRIDNRQPRESSETSAASPKQSGYGPKSSLSFGQLESLSDAALGLVMKTAPARVALLALTGATRSLVDRLFRQLPATDAKSLNRKIEQVGPIRLSDVELAQSRIADIANQLIDDGRIESPNSHRFAAAG